MSDVEVGHRADHFDLEQLPRKQLGHSRGPSYTVLNSQFPVLAANNPWQGHSRQGVPMPGNLQGQFEGICGR